MHHSQTFLNYRSCQKARHLCTAPSPYKCFVCSGAPLIKEMSWDCGGFLRNSTFQFHDMFVLEILHDGDLPHDLHVHVLLFDFFQRDNFHRHFLTSSNVRCKFYSIDRLNTQSGRKQSTCALSKCTLSKGIPQGVISNSLDHFLSSSSWNTANTQALTLVEVDQLVTTGWDASVWLA